MIYKQLPNIKQYNRNGDKIDPFCGNFEMPIFSEVAYSGDYYDLSNIPDITSSDNSINITYPFSNDSDVNSFDLTLNTSIVELIDFTNFHNYYIREVTDWTSEHSANLKHHIVHCELADEYLTIVDMSQSHSATTGVDRVFYYERNTTAASIVYIPLIAILGTDFTCSLNVSIQFGNTGEKFNTKCILLGDNPPDFTWCFCKNIPFNLVGQIDDRTPNGQLYEFIEIPEWFIGRIEISIYKIKPRVLGTIFTLTNNSNTPTVTEFIGSGTYELYPFTSLSSYSDSGIVRTFSTIVATSHDKYGVLDADFFIDDLSVFEKQSNNTIPDWIINDLYVHEVALRNRMNEIILRNTQLNFDNYYTKSEVDTALGNKQPNISITTDTSTPADNDTVIMQASGTTNTTTFLRRTMSKIWDYIRGKADSIYVSTAASQGLNSTAKSNAKANIGLDNVDNTSDATKKTNFTGSIASSNTGFVTGGDVYIALNSRYKTITVTNDNYTDASLFNDVRPGDVIRLNMNTFSNGIVNIYKCNHCFIILESVPDLFKVKNGTTKITVTGNLHGTHTNIIVYMEYYKFYVLSNVSDENALLCTNAAMNGGIMMYYRTSESKTAVVFDSEHPVTILVMNITNEEDLLILNKSSYVRAINSFGDIQHPSDTTKCSTFDGFFPTNVIRYTNYSSWEELFVGCGFSLANDYTINPSHRLYGLKKAFYHAYSYNSHITNVDLTTTIISNTDLTSCFESADGFNVILDGVDLTNNTCTDMFKDAKNITISAIGCNQDTIDKINANISGSYTSTITVITTDPNA